MEAVMLSSALEKSMSPYNQMKNPERLSPSFVMKRPSENLPPMSNIHGGLLFAPPSSLSSSFPPPGSLNQNFYQSQLQNHHLFRQQQLPLLPLPISQPLHSSLPARSRSLSVSSSPTNRKMNRSRDQSLTPKKSKSKLKKDLKSAETSGKVKEAIAEAKASSISAGPDSKNLPRDLSKILSSSFTLAAQDLVTEDSETISGLIIYTLSPHPSSLPLPKFSLKPKLSCKAEVAGIDTGATDDLQRMLWKGALRARRR